MQDDADFLKTHTSIRAAGYPPPLDTLLPVSFF